MDPVKETKRALNFIFFPFVHDPKSVLLKRGSVLLHSGGGGLSNEIELMIFTHGFVMATVTLEDAIRLFLALSDRAFLTEKSFLDFLRTRFQTLDYGGTGGELTFSAALFISLLTFTCSISLPISCHLC